MRSYQVIRHAVLPEGGGGIASRIPPGQAGESAASLLKTLCFVVFIDMRVQKHVFAVFS